jgi:hypothetical protein
MERKIFAGKGAIYSEEILRILFKKDDLTQREIAHGMKETYGDKHVQSLNSTISKKFNGPDGLVAKGFIEKTESEKQFYGDRKKGEGDTYSLTKNKGFYTALMLLNKDEVSKLSLTDFQDIPFFTEFYLHVKLVDKEDNFTTKGIYDRIHDAFNRLLKEDRYDLNTMTNDQFNKCIRVGWDSSIGDSLLSEDAFEELCKESKDVREMYLEFLEERKEYADQMEEQTKNEIAELNKELLAYLNHWHLVDSYMEKTKKSLMNLSFSD